MMATEEGCARVAAIYRVDPAHVKRFEVKSLNMVKISYPRTTCTAVSNLCPFWNCSFAGTDSA